MSKYLVGAIMSAAGEMTQQDWLFLLSILISVALAVKDYMEKRVKTNELAAI